MQQQKQCWQNHSVVNSKGVTATAKVVAATLAMAQRPDSKLKFEKIKQQQSTNENNSEDNSSSLSNIVVQ